MTGWLPVVLAAAGGAVAGAPAADGVRRLDAVVAGPRAHSSPVLLGAAGLVVLVCAVVGVPAAVLTAGGLVVVHRSVRRRSIAAEVARERVRALDALSMLAADLRAGRTPADAFAAAADIAYGDAAAALASAAAAARLGGDVGSALLAESSAVAATLRALAACWQVCSDAGSGLASAVERLEEGLRAAEAQRRAVAAELAGPRATAQLLAVLPLVGLALAQALGAHPLDLLLGTPVGLCCLAVGVALDALGVAWTRRLTDGAMP